MQNAILATYPTAKIRVFAVWFPVLDGDSRASWDPIVLNDSRVTNFWDPKRSVSIWFGENVTHGDVIETGEQLRTQVISLLKTG